MRAIHFKERRDGIYKKEGRQDRGGIYETWFINRL